MRHLRRLTKSGGIEFYFEASGLSLHGLLDRPDVDAVQAVFEQSAGTMLPEPKWQAEKLEVSRAA